MTDIPAPAGAPPAPSSAPSGKLDSPRGELRLGAVIIGLFFVLFLGWAAIAPLDAGAFATGSVAVSGNRQAVQHREGGTVTALRVEEGDRVRQGQVLIELSSGELRATERGVTGQVFALLAQRSRMIAERDGLRSIPVPPEFAALSPEDQQLANEALRLQRLQFGARGTSRATETGVLGQRVAQLNQQILGLERQIASNESQSRSIQQELQRFYDMDDQYKPVNRIAALERNAAAIEGEGGSLRAEVARIRDAIGQTRLETVGVSTKLFEDVAEQLRAAEIQLNELQPQLAQLRRQIANTRIVAPTTGQVLGLSVFTEGGVIQAGQTLMEIVPDNASQVIVASVNPADIDNLRVGLETEVKFPGLRERNPPILRGEVTRVAADAITPEGAQESEFRVEIVVPPSELEKLGRSADAVRPGMPVEIVILLKKRTALDYLIEPLTRSLWRTGSEQ
jgi:HlyD family secretion protein